MDQMLSQLNIQVNPRIFIKDPGSSDLGKKIIQGSIELMAKTGFEEFTFRKLSTKIKSPEASVYRYFESKHKLLLYLTSWYWTWMEYKIVFATANVKSPQEKIRKTLNLVVGEPAGSSGFAHIPIDKLHRIVSEESSKSYMTREVDQENKEGAFLAYKNVVRRIADLFKEINPEYPYPNMLASTIIEGAHHQNFFAGHLPSLTNLSHGKPVIEKFFFDIIQKTVSK